MHKIHISSFEQLADMFCSHIESTMTSRKLCQDSDFDGCERLGLSFLSEDVEHLKDLYDRQDFHEGFFQKKFRLMQSILEDEVKADRASLLKVTFSPAFQAEINAVSQLLQGEDFVELINVTDKDQQLVADFSACVLDALSQKVNDTLSLEDVQHAQQLCAVKFGLTK